MKKTMKKTVLLTVLCLALMPAAMGQGRIYLYHNIGDTIFGTDTIYHNQWDYMEWITDTVHHGLDITLWGLSPVTLRYCYTPAPINIMGVAAIMCVINIDSVTNHYDYLWGSGATRLQEYLYLYDATEDDFVLKGELPVTADDSNVRWLHFSFPSGSLFGATPNCCPMGNRLFHFPIREFYFDKAKTVEDSFYVGVSLYSDISENGERFYNGLITYEALFVQNPTYCPLYDPDCPDMPLQHYRFLSSDGNSWIHDDLNTYILVFPIVELDSSFFEHDSAYVGCWVARNLHVAEQGDGYAILQWEHRPGQARYQISYGPSGITPEQGTIVECPLNARSLTGLDSCTHYVAYVRAVCERSSTLYSDWSDSISIFICDTPPDTTDIDTTGGDTTAVMSPLERFTYLMPNPAAGQVTVCSSFSLSGVTLYGMHGECVMEQPLQGLAATLDISALNPGVYIVMIHTSQGFVSKKLVVQ